MQNSNKDTSRIHFLQRIDLSLLALILIMLAYNIPYWNKEFMVGHDTKNVYLTFHYYFNHLVWYGELPQWFPYGEYGYSSLFFQICNFTPSTYLVGLLGWLLRVKNTLLLFKLTIFGDQLIFLLGLHLLSRQLYRNRATRFIICLLGIGCIVWTWQIYWCLRLFYLLPLALYFFFRFFDEQSVPAFFATLFVLLFVFTGGLPYWAPIYLYLFLVLTAAMLPGNWRAFKSLAQPGLAGGIIALAVAIAGFALGYLLLTCLDGLHNYSPGRTDSGMHTDLINFLTFSKQMWQYMHSFIDGTLPSKAIPILPDDLNLYIGLLPIGTLALALRSINDRRLNTLFIGLVALVLLAGSGMTSFVLYWLAPGMKTFRHLGLILELAKILLLVSAGFGIDLLITRLNTPNWLKKHFKPITYFLCMACLCVILDIVVAQSVYSVQSWISPMQLATLLPTGGIWVIVRLSVWAFTLTALFTIPRYDSLKSLYSPRRAIYLLIFCCMTDITTFQLYQWQISCRGKYVGRLELKPFQYFHIRSDEPSEETKQNNAVIKLPGDVTDHGYYTNITQQDPCIPVSQVDLISQGVHELLTSRGATPSQEVERDAFIPSNDPQSQIILGCNAPKVRFVTQAQYGNTDQEISNMISTSTTLDSTVILKGNAVKQIVGKPLVDSAAMLYQPGIFNANRLDLNVSIKPDYTGWLVYADAFNPYWKAYINDMETPVLEAYRAFKAIAISGGLSKVSFRYENAWQKRAMMLLVALGIIGSLGCLVALGRQLVDDKEKPRNL
jgi:sorbitol-specific phosphotransferase system component IIC